MDAVAASGLMEVLLLLGQLGLQLVAMGELLVECAKAGEQLFALVLAIALLRLQRGHVGLHVRTLLELGGEVLMLGGEGLALLGQPVPGLGKVGQLLLELGLLLLGLLQLLLLEGPSLGRFELGANGLVLLQAIAQGG